ncbi:MAG: DUF4159 domain-containing protein [candidate division WOR-3 bacterium]|nr:DUF4159 domain-containing protein [candidate division WOR-3 bacterium]
MVFRRVILICLFIGITAGLWAFDFTPVRLRYEGGDWYNDENALTILADYINEHTPLKMDTSEIVCSMDNRRIMDYPFLFMTGHGGFDYTQRELENIRAYVLSGGFVYIDDDYGFNTDIMNFLDELFPARSTVKLSPDSDILSTFYKLDRLPKIHEHYDGEPEMYGIFIGEKIGVLYTFNSNISDGWAVYETHNDPLEKRIEALKTGVNIIYYALFK